LTYYRARYYDPNQGRFTQRDPLGYVDGINRYSYVHNNPINFNDPSGLVARAVSTWAQTEGISYVNTGLNYTQGALDVAGLAAQGPLEPFGVPIDLTNAGISALRGNYGDAALSASSAIPFIGIGANIAKVGNRAGDVVDVTKEADFFRGAKPGNTPDFTPRPNDFKVDNVTGTVKPTHGVSVFDNPNSISSNGFVPYKVDQSTIPDTLQIIQRGKDPAHFEITPKLGANLTPQQFNDACSKIGCSN